MSEEKIIPDRPEFDGTVAEALARMRAPAAFALWSVRFGSDALRAWQDCDRPDWMIDAIALSAAYEPGSEAHRKVVRILCMGAAAALAAAGNTDPRPKIAIESALGWCEGTVRVQTVVQAAEEAAAVTGDNMGKAAVLIQGEPTDEQEHLAMLTFGAASAAFYAATTVFTASAAMTAAMSIAISLSHDLVDPDFTWEIRSVFPSPPPEMVP